jgi:hypothetical protein
LYLTFNRPARLITEIPTEAELARKIREASERAEVASR